MKLQLDRSGPWIGITGLVVVLAFYLAVVVRVHPWWGGAVMLLLWFGMLALSIRWATHRPYVVLAMPIVAMVVWFVVLLAGGAWLGWSA